MQNIKNWNVHCQNSGCLQNSEALFWIRRALSNEMLKTCFSCSQQSISEFSKQWVFQQKFGRDLPKIPSNQNHPTLLSLKNSYSRIKSDYCKKQRKQTSKIQELENQAPNSIQLLEYFQLTTAQHTWSWVFR